MLHHPFVDWDDLLSVNGEVYASYVDAFRACTQRHVHPEDFYTDLEESGELGSESDTDSDDSSDDEDGDHPLADFEIFAHRRPQEDFPRVDIDGLGYQDMDRDYDWSVFFGRYPHPSSIFNQHKDANPINQVVTSTSSPEGLNTEQRKMYDVIVGQYARELAVDQPEPSQLLLHVDGAGGAGKTVALLRTCARLQELAAVNGKQNPVFRAAPTGIAAYAIMGRTLHSLLRLPVRGKMSDLSTATLQSLQAMFKDSRFLMIDEKSMMDLKMLSLIDNRLRVIIPATSDQPFGGINILLCGDFFQLPPVGGKPLYTLRPSHIHDIKGRQLYKAFDKTIRLTEIMRQQGNDPISVGFRQTLSELREDKLTREGWEFLCTRVANELTPAEVASMDDALRLYFTRAEVYETNSTNLAATNQPVRKISAQHTGRKAKKATEEEAKGLSAEIFVSIGAKVMLTTNLWSEAGLANGSMGTIHDMSWDVGLDISSMPSVILVKFSGYEGPAFPGCEDDIVPVFPANRQFEYKGVSCSRTQFPLRLAYAITVHKSQGMSLDTAVMNLAQKEHCMALSYVAVSRLRKATGMVFEKPFDFEHFKHKPTEMSRDRQADFVFRTSQLL